MSSFKILSQYAQAPGWMIHRNCNRGANLFAA
jgi:hypothetical protein